VNHKRVSVFSPSTDAESGKITSPNLKKQNIVNAYKNIKNKNINFPLISLSLKLATSVDSNFAGLDNSNIFVSCQTATEINIKLIKESIIVIINRNNNI
tara:strand:- start:1166 stop:1462 length:297 start_codon:yes stop_codon:yes gene_type:complete